MSGELVFRHVRFRNSGQWSEDEYDVMQGDLVVGRIFRPGAGAPANRPWQWTVLDPTVAPRVGFVMTRHEARAAFARSWRKARAVAVV